MRYLLWAICLAMLLVFTEVFSRPLLPPDETRYLSVAWEARVGGNHLVSHLNSETYAHKPPLLFWLINAAWSVTGLNEYAARLVSPAAGIICIPLTALMARRLWPEFAALHRCVPMMLTSMVLWVVFCPVTMFDTLLTCFTLLAFRGVLRAEAGASVTGWLIAGVAFILSRCFDSASHRAVTGLPLASGRVKKMVLQESGVFPYCVNQLSRKDVPLR